MIGGLSREFYYRVYLHYQKDVAWNCQPRSEYGNEGQGTIAINDSLQTMWVFEPHVAEQIFEDFIAENNITVLRDEWLGHEKGVVMDLSQNFNWTIWEALNVMSHDPSPLSGRLGLNIN